MTPAVEQAPVLSAADAVRIAREIYGLEAEGRPLPSERDQNFHLDAGGAGLQPGSRDGHEVSVVAQGIGAVLGAILWGLFGQPIR